MTSSGPTTRIARGLVVRAPARPGDEVVLSPDALEFLAGLQRRFGAERARLLAARTARQAALDAGSRPDFLPGTAELRAATWKVAPAPPDLTDRRVEITGPVDRKLVINALNSGASTFMADFEDSSTPTWANLIDGQLNLRAAVRRTIRHTGPDGRQYALAERTATLIVRPRGWHLPEEHVLVDGAPMSGSLFDFGLYLFHNHAALAAAGSGPYFYLPKLQGHLEARLWNEVFLHAQAELGLPRGTIRATVLIEHVLAAFEMDEILWELREHVTGLNCGRWDYIFSFIKTLRADPAAVLPDRALITMESRFLRSYSLALIATCHRRGAHAMGGMAAQIPIRDDALANRRALARVEADKRREAGDGHDGTWVAHPGLVPLARGIFDELMPGPNQLERSRADVKITARDLLAVPEGPITAEGVTHNISVGVRYLAAWLSGTGCVPLDGLMEDAATAEISRAQLWQWIRHGAHLADGRTVTAALVRDECNALVARLSANTALTGADHLRAAAELFLQLCLAEELPEFLTLPAYARLLRSSD